jgi:hypothetical protein
VKERERNDDRLIAGTDNPVVQPYGIGVTTKLSRDSTALRATGGGTASFRSQLATARRMAAAEQMIRRSGM